MIDRTQLLSDLQTLVRQLENDLQERIDSPEVPEVGEKLKAEFQKAKKADRTAQTFNQWVSDYKTQVAVAWVLSATFARFLEDNGLVSPPRISGKTLTPSPSPQGEGKWGSAPPSPWGEGGWGDEGTLQRARDEHELYFRDHPTETDREYLLWMFRQLAKLPGAQEIFGEGNLIWDLPNWLSGDAAGDILKQFQAIDPNTGDLVHDFTDPEWDARFLGDLYQDLSEAARKKYALLQTPVFVEEFILDRTLEPAVEEFGLSDFRIIDPACGSGHFLLGSFHRLLDRWLRKEPGTNVEELARRALESVHGVDVNPFAVAIARFRLLLAAMKATNQKALKDARDYPLNLACGDSLLHGEGSQLVLGDWAPMAHHFVSEDIAALNQILRRGHYHAVVANPPYILARDKALNQAYRQRYETCHRKYSLAVPFMERIFQLAVPGGYTGQITANSFMKREFGKKLIEEFFPKVDLTHVIDTSGAYIPGHGTPTVILFGRNRAPIASTIRTVMGIRGEPSTPEDPTMGLVWSAILDQVDVEGSESEFVSVADSQRDLFHKHPWSIGGGGASELKEQLEAICKDQLKDFVTEIGFFAITGEDDIFSLPQKTFHRYGVEKQRVRKFVIGEIVRDWGIEEKDSCLFPYTDIGKSDEIESAVQFLWNYRELLKGTIYFGKDKSERGMNWWEYVILLSGRIDPPVSIAFAFVATHNHFVLDRGGKVFKQSAPVIKLPAGATEDDHLALLGLLNSAIACFWMKQVFHCKGSTVDQRGARQTTVPFEDFWEYDGTKIKQFPIPKESALWYAKKMDQFAAKLDFLSPSQNLNADYSDWILVLQSMISLQEELDWRCYELYKLADKDLVYPVEPPPLQLGQRAFEIIMARKMVAGELKTTWFDRHRSTPITELPDHWPDDYKQLVERRIELIETDKSIGLIEQPEYKRRWNTEPWESQLERALQSWLLNRLESYFDFDGRMKDPHPQPLSPGRGEPESASTPQQSTGPDTAPTPPSPWGEGGRGDEGDWNVEASYIGGKLRQVPEVLLQRARELRQAQTPAEEILWACLRNRGLMEAKFRRQHNLGPYIADFYCHQAKLVVELDGSIHASQRLRDGDRDKWMQSQGLRVLRFSNESVLNDMEGVLGSIAEGVSPHPQPLSLGRGEPEAALTPPSPQGEGGWGDEGIGCQITEPALISTVKLADIARKDPDFLQVGELYTKDPAFDVLSLVNTLVETESVPLLPSLRYKPNGLRKRQDWQHTWQLQRQEDAIDAHTQLPKDHPDYLDSSAADRLKTQEIGPIPVPPKYKTSDFQKNHYWKLRGKLDVPKERWVSFPHCEGPDGQPVIAWAGYDHLQLALAISTYFVYIKEEVGGSDDPRLVPLLVGLIELLPWLKQWHNELDPTYNLKMGDYIEGFIDDEARQLNLTLEEIQSWEPPAKKGRRRRR